MKNNQLQISKPYLKNDLFSYFSPENDDVTESPPGILIPGTIIFSTSMIFTTCVLVIKIFTWKKNHTTCFEKLKSNGNFIYYNNWTVTVIIQVFLEKKYNFTNHYIFNILSYHNDFLRIPLNQHEKCKQFKLREVIPYLKNRELKN